MGDMADMLNEQIWDMEEARIDYRQGRMGDVEAYEMGIIDELGYEIRSGRTVTLKKTCLHCGMTGLKWGQVDGKWRLHEGKTQHNCPAFRKL
jgi:hypothetical protein